jgi:L-asparaginase
MIFGRLGCDRRVVDPGLEVTLDYGKPELCHYLSLKEKILKYSQRIVQYSTVQRRNLWLIEKSPIRSGRPSFVKSRFFTSTALAMLTAIGLTIASSFAHLPAGKTLAQSAPTASPTAPSTTQSVPATDLPNVLILATGGTIAGTGATSTTTVGYQAAQLPVNTLVAAVPELQTLANVSGEQVLQISSQDMTAEGLLTIAKRVNTALAQPDIDGVVITHGTDTLEETAYFLNLVVKSEKPVVIVGSMRPSTALSADGPLNLYNAVALASSEAATGKGVLVTLSDQISAAREVTKTNTTSVNTFQSPDLGYLGYIELGKPYFYRETTHQHTTNTPFDVGNLSELPQVEIIYGYSGNGRSSLDAAVADGAQGIVYAGVGNGNFSQQVIPAVTSAVSQGVVVTRSARTGAGRVARNGEMNDDELGTVAADNLNPQKARILLMLALTQTTDAKAIQEMFYAY